MYAYLLSILTNENAHLYYVYLTNEIVTVEIVWKEKRKTSQVIFCSQRSDESNNIMLTSSAFFWIQKN